MENAYDMGLCSFKILEHAEDVCDAVMRLQGGQYNYWVDFVEAENKRTRNFQNQYQLANDTLFYNVIQLMAIMTHPCQKCAEDPKAWHTRSAFCDHREKKL